MSPGVTLDRERLAEFCRRYHVRRLSLFGSVLTDRFGPESDVDVLVEFEPHQGPGYFGLARMQRELSTLVGRKVDLRTPLELSRYFRDEVVSRAQVEYSAA
jgi:predicted nucleotidyltransferase